MSEENAGTETKTSEVTTPPESATTLMTPEKSETTSTEAKTQNADGSETSSSAPALDFEKLTIPDGFELAEADREELAAIAGETGLTQTALEKLSNFYFTRLVATVERLNASVGETWTETNKAWEAETLKQFNGDRAAAVKAAEKFQPIIDRFGGDALREALAVTGAGNHPAMFAFFQQIADSLGEATPVAAQAVAKTEDPTRAFYKNSPELFKE